MTPFESRRLNLYAGGHRTVLSADRGREPRRRRAVRPASGCVRPDLASCATGVKPRICKRCSCCVAPGGTYNPGGYYGGMVVGIARNRGRSSPSGKQRQQGAIKSAPLTRNQRESRDDALVGEQQRAIRQHLTRSRASSVTDRGGILPRGLPFRACRTAKLARSAVKTSIRTASWRFASSWHRSALSNE